MRILLVCALLFACGLLAQNDPVSDAVEALQHRDLTSAERILRTELRAHPENTDALGVLAVVLDQAKKYSEADAVYKRAVALTPRSPALLNNYGNHLLTVGNLDAAHDAFAKVIAIDPANANALLQLAHIALARKSGGEALRYLDRLPANTPQQNVEITRMQALFLLNRTSEAEAILQRQSAAAGSDARGNYELGVALAGAQQYAKAEERFSRALEGAPDNFDVLYNLALAASHAGHNERAREILESALRRQPENVDVLYDLAAVNAQLNRKEAALKLLAQASGLAPARPDVQQLLARTTADLGYFGDAIQAWDRYLELVPKDDVARRERAFAASAIGDDTAAALAGLKAYAARHPADPVGHYELGIAEASAAPDDARREFNRALALKPNLTAALIARGLLRFKQGEFTAALPDFEAAIKEEPNNPVVLDRLGQTYMALDRSADAVPLLRKAAELAPRDSKTLMHLGRALTNTGQEGEAKAIFARFRELGPDQSSNPHPAGLVDFLSLSSQEQIARYRAGVERTVKNDPRNAEAQVLYLKLLLDEGKTADALAVAHHVSQLAPSASLLADAGNALLAAGHYAAAKECLEEAARTEPSATVSLNLAIATMHADNPQAALEQLERIPQAQRSGDYYLVRAQALDACGRSDEAAAALSQGLRAHPTRADLYRYAAAFLIERGRAANAVTVMDRAIAAIPDNPEIGLMRAVALEGAGNTSEVERTLQDIEKRWPDWNAVWLAQAIVSAWGGNDVRARQMVQLATALGAAGAEERFQRAAKAKAIQADAGGRGVALLRALFP